MNRRTRRNPFGDEGPMMMQPLAESLDGDTAVIKHKGIDPASLPHSSRWRTRQRRPSGAVSTGNAGAATGRAREAQLALLRDGAPLSHPFFCARLF